MRRALLLVVVLLIGLAFFNPDMDDFKVFAETQSERMILREIGGSDFGSALAGIGASLAGNYIDRITERTNYVVFSTYTIDLDQDASDDDAWRFVGIAGRFIEVEKPASMREGDARR